MMLFCVVVRCCLWFNVTRVVYGCVLSRFVFVVCVWLLVICCLLMFVDVCCCLLCVVCSLLFVGSGCCLLFVVISLLLFVVSF